MFLQVEWYPATGPENPEELSETDSEREDEEEPTPAPEHNESKLSSLMDRLTFKKKKKHVHPKIIPELAALGVYAQSVKPKKNWLSQRTSPGSDLCTLYVTLTISIPTAAPEDPTHLFLNLSESSMSSILPAKIQEFVTRGAAHQVRVYPKGTRIRSNNYNPSAYWRGGAQICAQNWQRFDKGMQITRAMFEGTGGWKVKPRALLGEHAKEIEEHSEEHEGVDVDMGRIMIGPQKFTCEILGASASESFLSSSLHDSLCILILAYSSCSSSTSPYSHQRRRQRQNLHHSPTLPLLRRREMALPYGPRLFLPYLSPSLLSLNGQIRPRAHT